MFKFVALMFAVLSLHSQAEAQMHNRQQGGCQRTEQRFICPGDRVIDQNGDLGVVRGANPFQGTVAVNYGGSTSYSKNIPTLSITEGCVRGFCVGDSVIDANGDAGVIKGVNPFNVTVAINYGGSTSYHRSLKTLSVTFGCLKGFCIGDSVIDSNGDSAIVTAINFIHQTAAINFGGSTSYSKNVETLSATNYCVDYEDRYREMTSYSGGYMQTGPNIRFPYSKSRSRARY